MCVFITAGVFITAVPILGVCVYFVCVYYCRTGCVFITAGPITKLCAWGRRRVEDMCGTREEPGTLIQGAPVFPGSSRLGIEPKTPGWLVQAQPPAHRGI
jgi:hypothetical protein